MAVVENMIVEGVAAGAFLRKWQQDLRPRLLIVIWSSHPLVSY